MRLIGEIGSDTSLRKLPPQSRILDAGAGELANKQFCSHLEYVSQDFCKYDGKGDGAALQTKKWETGQIDIVSDICHIPQPKGSFDAILCSEVFEHIPEPVKALKEFNRLLKIDGVLILSAPFCSLTHFSPHHYSSGYNRYYYDYHLGRLGFEVEQNMPNGSFFEYIAQEIRRIPKISRAYAGQSPFILENLASRILLKMLERFSLKDNGSDELLCFGYQVVGVKKIDCC